jgi:hypothetical protein
MKSFTIAIAAISVVSIQTILAGEVSGKVTLKGKPPEELKLPLDPMCGKFNNNQPVTTRHYLTGADNGLANVWVFVKNPPAGGPPAGDAPVLDQVNCLYQPYVFGIRTGQKLIIRNSDPLLHNVNTSASTVPSHRFNIAQPTKGKEDVKTFDKPELPLKFLCNVHNWMFAWAGVFEHPYYAVTDKDGKFKLPDLPAGKYTIVAKHLKAGETTQEISVDGNKTADFTLSVPAAAK